MKRLLPLITLLLLVMLPAAAAAQPACVQVQGCTPETGVPEVVIASYPTPNVYTLPIDDGLLYDRTYRKIHGPVELFDAPGGAVVRGLGSGFTFVTINRFEGDWAQLSSGEWVANAALTTDVALSRFSGVRLPTEARPYPTAWLMRHLRPSSVPGAEPDENLPLMYRYTLVNLYTFVEVEGKRWYQIAPNQWLHQFNVAKINPIERPAEVDTQKWVSVDLYEQSLVAYEGQTPVFATLISSGLTEWPTNEGLFHVYLRYTRTEMSGAEQQADFYSLQEVPWTMYFDGDIALHGAYWHDGFGYRRSHGCVNLSVTDAHWLFQWSADEHDFTVPNDTGMAVYVFSSGQYD